MESILETYPGDFEGGEAFSEQNGLP